MLNDQREVFKHFLIFPGSYFESSGHKTKMFKHYLKIIEIMILWFHLLSTLKIPATVMKNTNRTLFNTTGFQMANIFELIDVKYYIT